MPTALRLIVSENRDRKANVWSRVGVVTSFCKSVCQMFIVPIWIELASARLLLNLRLLSVEVLRSLQHFAHVAPVHANEMIPSSWGARTAILRPTPATRRRPPPAFNDCGSASP